MFKKPSLYILALALMLCLFSIKMDSPPAVIDADVPDSVFSAKRAYPYLEEICKAPHSTGTPENQRVREYIVEKCKQFGLETTVQHTTAIRRRAGYVAAANVFNVVARLKGSNTKKSLLVMAHYDSQPNTPGAGDDGAGVAAMLETARILTSTGKTLQNDVVFLFTDAEEWGLLGAQGFIQDSVLTKEIGLVLNFEGRGNAGISWLFEINAQNGWAVEHYMQAAEYPTGNSLGYEIYKLLPNDTDYTVFREAGISGLNSAFIDGYVNYHSPNDKAKNLDLRSLQHHGSNMLSLIKHFGNIPLEDTKSKDISFFNLIGNVMVSYPASWNLALTILSILLLITLLVIGFRNKQITVKGILVGFFAFAGLLILLGLSIFILIQGITSLYPLYKNFYDSNSYNSVYYFIAFTSLAILMYAFLYRWLLARNSQTSLFAGILVLLTIILVLLYVYMPSAIFFLLFPLLFTISGNILILVVLDVRKSMSGIIQIAFLLPALLLFPPMLKTIYVVFGLGLVAGGAVVLLGLFLGLLLPLFATVLEERKWLVPALAAASFFISLVGGHITSGFTEDAPLQSTVQYQVRANENKAYWITAPTQLDDWNKQFFPSPKNENGRLLNEATLIPISAPTAVITKDTVENNVRHLSLHCQSIRNALTMRLEFIENLPSVLIIDGPAGGNGNIKSLKGSYQMLNYVGLDSTGFDLMMEVQPNVPVKFTLIDRSMGLPKLNEFRDYPPHIVPRTGQNANTTQVVKELVF